MLNTTECLVVITCCTHCEVGSLVTCIKKVSGSNHIYAIIGGLHWAAVQKKEILADAERLRNVGHTWVNHCTGSEVLKMLRDVLRSKVGGREQVFKSSFHL
ncbi:hypothetical protein LLG46_15300 [bacterium]|nr:hypothetical protein [bacterium]